MTEQQVPTTDSEPPAQEAGRRVAVHPALVTVPIGCWVGSLVFDIASHYVTDPAFLSRGSTWLVGIGLIGAVIAGIAGFVDSIPVPPGTRAHRAVLVHMGLVMCTIVLYATCFFLRLGPGEQHAVPLPVLALSVVSFLVLVATGYYGGAVVHRHGYHAGAVAPAP